MVSQFTAAELEELARYDALVNASRMTAADYRQIKFNEELLFPEQAKERERTRAQYAARKAAQIESGEYEQARERERQYAEANREKIKARKAAWYQANRERIRVQQAAYRLSKRCLNGELVG